MTALDGVIEPDAHGDRERVRLSRGTVVVPAVAVRRYGRAMLEAMFPDTDVIEVDEVRGED